MLNPNNSSQASIESPLSIETFDLIKDEEASLATIEEYLAKIDRFLSTPGASDHPDYLKAQTHLSRVTDYQAIAEEKARQEEKFTAKNWFAGKRLTVTPEELDRDISLMAEDESFTEQDRISQFMFLSKKTGISSYDLERYYQAKKQYYDEREHVDSAKQELTELLELEKSRLDLTQLIPGRYAEQIISWCEKLDFRPESAFTTMLCGLSSCFDYRSRIELIQQTSYYQPAFLYGGLVGESGTGKSALFKKFMTQPLRRHQDYAEQTFQRELAEAKRMLTEYKLATKEEKLDGSYDGEPELPKRAKRYYLTESTIETFAHLFKSYEGNTILYASDELNKMFKSLSRYSGGDSGDMEKLLELYDGSPLVIGRVGTEGNLYVPQTGLAIFGGVQPEVLKDIWGDGNDREGKSSRFIYTYQPLTSPQLDPNDPAPQTCPLDESLDVLYSMLIKETFTTYKLSPVGRHRYISFFNELSNLNKQSDNRFLGHCYSKAKGQCGRLMLVLHAINSIWQKQYSGVPNLIPDEVVDKAIILTSYYLDQVTLLHKFLCADDYLTVELRDVLSLLRSKEVIKAKDVKRYRRSLRNTNSGDIRSLFYELEKMGYGFIEGTGNKAVLRLIPDPQ